MDSPTAYSRKFDRKIEDGVVLLQTGNSGKIQDALATELPEAAKRNPSTDHFVQMNKRMKERSN